LGTPIIPRGKELEMPIIIRNVDKYYNTGDDRHHGFGILISNSME